MRGIYIYMVSAALATSLSAKAQYAWQEDENTGKLDLTHNITYMIESQGSVSDGKTPLWLNANKYGLSSLDEMVMPEWLWCDLCKQILLIVGLLAMAWMLPYQ